MNLNLDNDDITLLDKLLEISKKILKIYNNLYNLEINNQLNSFEYQKQLKFLTICKEIEDELYKQINYKKISDYIDYSDQYNLVSHLSDYDLILDDLEELFYVKRVYNKLKDFNTLNLTTIYQERNLNQNDNPPYDHSIFVSTSIHDDIENIFVFLTFNYDNQTYKDKLIKIKYLISFLNSRIEFNNLNNLFLNSDKLFLQSKLVTDNLNFDEDSYKRLVDIYFFKYIKFHLKEFKNKNNKFRNIILKCLIKANLELQGDKSILNKLNNKILKKLLEEFQNNKNVIHLRSEKINIK